LILPATEIVRLSPFSPPYRLRLILPFLLVILPIYHPSNIDLV